jgi:hypothetical protein
LQPKATLPTETDPQQCSIRLLRGWPRRRPPARPRAPTHTGGPRARPTTAPTHPPNHPQALVRCTACKHMTACTRAYITALYKGLHLIVLHVRDMPFSMALVRLLTMPCHVHRSADFLDIVFLRTYTYKNISRYKVVGADPTDIDIYSVRAPAYLWRPMVPYYR